MNYLETRSDRSHLKEEKLALVHSSEDTRIYQGEKGMLGREPGLDCDGRKLLAHISCGSERKQIVDPCALMAFPFPHSIPIPKVYLTNAQTIH